MSSVGFTRTLYGVRRPRRQIEIGYPAEYRKIANVKGKVDAGVFFVKFMIKISCAGIL